MSRPVSRISHPFDVVGHPNLEPEVRRSILARWASDRFAVPGQPGLRRAPPPARSVPVDDVFAALRKLDENQPRGEQSMPTPIRGRKGLR